MNERNGPPEPKLADGVFFGPSQGARTLKLKLDPGNTTEMLVIEFFEDAAETQPRRSPSR